MPSVADRTLQHLLTLTLLLTVVRSAAVPADIVCADADSTQQAIIDCVGRDTYFALKEDEEADVAQCLLTETTQDGGETCIENSRGYQNFLDTRCPCEVAVIERLCGTNTIAHQVSLAMCGFLE